MVSIVYAYELEVKVLRQLAAKNDHVNLEWVNWRPEFGPAPILKPCDAVVNVGFAGRLGSRSAIGNPALVDRVGVGFKEEVEWLAPSIPDSVARFANETGINSASLLTSQTPVTDETIKEMCSFSGADLVDMEAFYVLKAANELALPFVGLKLVSDNADGEARRLIKKRGGEWSQILGETAFVLIRKII